MNWFQFGRLIHSIYGRNNQLPDLDWIQSLGLLAVKLGQVHALRIDFLEREKCEHLATLVYPKLRQVGDPVGILGDIEEYTLSELDLRHEVAGQRALRAIYDQNRDTFDLSRLAFARVHESL